jgi:hypothetical protein
MIETGTYQAALTRNAVEAELRVLSGPKKFVVKATHVTEQTVLASQEKSSLAIAILTRIRRPLERFGGRPDQGSTSLSSSNVGGSALFANSHG